MLPTNLPPSTARASATLGKAGLPLFALAIGAFGVGTTEFGPMGMLPTIAHGIDVSIPTAGTLVSAYAIGVMVGAPIMTLMLARWRQRTALIALMGIFIAGNLLSAIAPGYVSLLVARVVTSLTHGAFFGIASIVAASLVPRDRQASAIAMMFMGLTVANVIGVPAATWIGQVIGWRESFGVISGLGIIAMLALRAAIPLGPRGETPNVKAELKVLTKRPVVMGLLTTIMSSAAMFTLYTYISPTIQSLTNASPGFIMGMLTLIGVGFTVGASLGGKLADLSLERSLLGFFVVVGISMMLLPWTGKSQVGAAATLFIWAVACFAAVPPLQTLVMRSAVGAPGLASAFNIGAFNLGNAIGAGIGGLVLKQGLSYGAVSVAGAVVISVAILLVVAQMSATREISTNSTIA